jgi:hypothetical protein
VNRQKQFACRGVLARSPSAAVANALEPGRQQFVAIIRRRLDGGIVVVAGASSEMRSMSEAAAKTMATVGRGGTSNHGRRSNGYHGNRNDLRWHDRSPWEYAALNKRSETSVPTKCGHLAATEVRGACERPIRRLDCALSRPEPPENGNSFLD